MNLSRIKLKGNIIQRDNTGKPLGNILNFHDRYMIMGLFIG